MNTRKFFTFRSRGQRWFVLLTVLLLVSGLFLTQAPAPTLGMRREDPTDTYPIGVGNDPPAYVTPANGFSWAMEKRFGTDKDGDGLIDYHWTPDGYVEDGTYVHGHYDPAYVYPTSWKITFNGCQTSNDSYALRPDQYEYVYDWTLDGASLTTASCKPTLTFTDKASHPVGLTVTNMSDGNITVFPEQMIQVKDYFIVSIGDSYASGQGNPDIEQEVISGPFGFGWVQVSPAVWQDERCHRSANAAPALAAMALEASDPHSSVTFISFACTGATIQTPSYDLIPQIDADPLWENRGSGILGPQRGEITDVEWGDYEHYIKPQMQQLEEALAASNGQDPRQIDSLLISGGGNDMKFGPLIRQCTIFTNCWVNWWAQMAENPVTDTQWYTLYDLVTRAVGKWTGDNPPVYTIPGNYADLGARINSLDPKPLHVYVTQYPDPTINDRGVSNEANETYQHHCRMLDDVAWPNPLNVVTDLEALTASHHAQGELNEAVRNSVAALASTYTEIDWQFVDGLSVFDVDPDPAVAGKPGLFKGGPNGGPGHGYCASDNWIRRADESELIQGPVNFRFLTVGTMHPNYSGQHVIKSRILRYMLPDLTGQPSEAAPSFSFSYTSWDLTSQPGLNGWYTGSCSSPEGAQPCYPKVVAQAVATSNSELKGALMLINDEVAGQVPGVGFHITPSADKKQVTYSVEIFISGTYRFQFNAQDANGQVSFLQKEIKVDLEDPILATPIGPFEVEEGSSVVLSANVATDAQGIPLNGDVMVDFEWDLDNDGIFETTDERPTFSAADLHGPLTQPIRVQVADRAGRTATALSEVHVLHVGPTVTIEGAPTTSTEGSQIDLPSLVTGLAPFTYVWEVEKDGSNYDNSTDAYLSFTPYDNGSYVVMLSVTDADGKTGTASVSIDVTNVPPTPSIRNVPANNPEGTAISLTSAVNDPGFYDSFTYAWSAVQGDRVLASGTNSTFSFTPDDNGSYVVSLNVIDNDGGVGSTSQTIAVTNVAPALRDVAVTPGTVDEGGSVTLSGSVSDPGSRDTFTLTINWGDGSDPEDVLLAAGSPSFSRSHTYADDNPTGTASDTNNISLSLKDKDGGIGTGSASVVVNNLAPSLSITAPADGALYAINTSVSLNGDFSDGGTLDTFSCSVDWGDGDIASGTLTAGKCSANHAYSAAGVYNVKMTVSDDDTGSDVKMVMVVVYDPSAGFVTGGGWINSPTGAYKLDGSLTGKATFGFVSKYQKGATVPTGNTEFQFHAGGFKFHSTAYEWLVVNTGGTNAQFKGFGLVNGALDPNGNAYKFMLWATDGSPDTFRIRIWWEDASGEHDVYDNGVDQAIGGGSIVVHTKK
jgi:PKD repeat protein